MNWLLTRVFRLLSCLAVAVLLALQMMQMTAPTMTRGGSASEASLVSLTAMLTTNYTRGSANKSTIVDTRIQQQQQQPPKDALPHESAADPIAMDSCRQHFGSPLAWLQADDKIKNIPQLNLDAEFALFQKESSSFSPRTSSSVLDFTLCLEDSPFRRDDLAPLANADANDKTVDFWLARLVYMAFTYHQYEHAWEEYQQRQAFQPTCQDTWQQAYNASLQTDYACPAAKYLVVTLSGNGLGMNWNRVVLKAMLVGLATHRVVVLVNTMQPIPPADHHALFLRHPWILASCQPRRDAQCFFRPFTPCVPTRQQVLQSPALTMYERQLLTTHGIDPYVNETVLVYTPHEAIMSSLTLVKERLNQIFSQLPVPPAVAQAAAQRLSTAVHKLDDIPAGIVVQGALLLYFLRPLPEKLQALDRIQASIVQQLENVTSMTMGLPIRGTDKCGQKESECMQFPSYVRAAHDYWVHQFPQHGNQTIPIMLTSEAQPILQNGLDWNKLNGNVKDWQRAPIHFFTNPHDITQGTGFMMRTPLEQRDDIMMSSLSSFRAQLINRIVMGNCCSNWHKIIGQGLAGGCGRHDDVEFKCLSTHHDEQFRLCCKWTKTQFCKDRRAGKIPKAP